MKVTSYDALKQYLRGFKDGHLNLLVIHGRPSKGKTELVQSILPDALVRPVAEVRRSQARTGQRRKRGPSA
jgi:hypothetical protein